MFSGAGGSDPAGIAHAVEFDGFLNRPNKLGVLVDHPALGRTELVLLVVSGEDLRGFERHGAVQIDRHLWYPAFRHDLVDKMQKHLCAPDGKRRNEHNTTAPCSLGGNVGQFGLRSLSACSLSP